MGERKGERFSFQKRRRSRKIKKLTERRDDKKRKKELNE